MDLKKSVKSFFRNVPDNLSALVAQGMRLIPGQVPKVVFLELVGDYPVFAPKSLLPVAIPLPGQRKLETLEDLKDQLEAMAEIPELEEIVILERGFSGGFVTAFVVRQMLLALVNSGKTVSFYADGFSNLTLYLASACSKVVTLSEGQLMTVGLAGRVLFQANMFKKIGIEVEFERRSEYKNAVNQLTETGLTPEHREALSGLLGSLNAHWLESIASGRKLEVGVVEKAINAAPLLAHEALEHGLLTGIAFEDELTLNAKPLLEAMRFASAPSLDWSDTGCVALIGVEGGIVDGESKNNPLPIPFFGGQTAGGYSVARAIRSATADESIKAIVLYVDSPGGSALASEIIWREVCRAKAVKPVVAVMGAVAASGGYYVSCAATRILAAPSTITGSIGVFNLHLSNAGLWEKLGLSTETIKFAENADYFSPDRTLTSSEKGNVKRSVQHIYDTFKKRVADGRNLSLEAVEAVAQGQVWTGLQALEHGLVDEIGSVFDGLRVARELAGLPEFAATVHFTPPAKFVAPTDVAAMTKVFDTRIWALLPQQLEIR
jgi:protease IV